MTEPEHLAPNAADSNEPRLQEQDEQEPISSPENVPGPESPSVEDDAPISSPENVPGPESPSVEDDAAKIGADNTALAADVDENTTTGEPDLTTRISDASWF